jgi:hypothetical protein
VAVKQNAGFDQCPHRFTVVSALKRGGRDVGEAVREPHPTDGDPVVAGMGNGGNVLGGIFKLPHLRRVLLGTVLTFS